MTDDDLLVGMAWLLEAGGNDRLRSTGASCRGRKAGFLLDTKRGCPALEWEASSKGHSVEGAACSFSVPLNARTGASEWPPHANGGVGPKPKSDI